MGRGSRPCDSSSEPCPRAIRDEQMALEHRLTVGFFDCIIWIDKLFLKPLEKAVPDLDGLLDDPARRLSEEPITIGPRRKYAATFFLSLALAIPNWIWILYLSASLLDKKKKPLIQQPDGPFLLTVLLAAVLGALVATILVARWILRGGQMVLTPEGVELWHRRSMVFCPWSLFHAAGEPLKRGAGDVLLPVRADAVPFVELYKRGNLRARGEDIKCRQLQFKGCDQVLVRALYVVRTVELAELLLRLGYTLGAALPEHERAWGFTNTTGH